MSERRLSAVDLRKSYRGIGGDVDVLASVEDASGSHPVLVQQGRILATSFHPELTDDARLHALLTDLVRGTEE